MIGAELAMQPGKHYQLQIMQTNGLFYRPSGKCFDLTGINPDVSAPLFHPSQQARIAPLDPIREEDFAIFPLLCRSLTPQVPVAEVQHSNINCLKNSNWILGPFAATASPDFFHGDYQWQVAYEVINCLLEKN